MLGGGVDVMNILAAGQTWDVEYFQIEKEFTKFPLSQYLDYYLGRVTQSRAHCLYLGPPRLPRTSRSKHLQTEAGRHE